MRKRKMRMKIKVKANEPRHLMAIIVAATCLCVFVNVYSHVHFVDKRKDEKRRDIYPRRAPKIDREEREHHPGEVFAKREHHLGEDYTNPKILEHGCTRSC